MNREGLFSPDRSSPSRKFPRNVQTPLQSTRPTRLLVQRCPLRRRPLERSQNMPVSLHQNDRLPILLSRNPDRKKKRQISVSSPKVTFPRFPPLKLPPSPAPGGLRPRSPRPHCLVAAIDRLLLEILVFKSPSLRQACLLSLAICPPWHPPSGKRLLHNQIDKPA